MNAVAAGPDNGYVTPQRTRLMFFLNDFSQTIQSSPIALPEIPLTGYQPRNKLILSFICLMDTGVTATHTLVFL
ncbi:uncharacterized protein Dvar_09240 [Desulfosarcina variabilis str. Montpellier]